MRKKIFTKALLPPSGFYPFNSQTKSIPFVTAARGSSASVFFSAIHSSLCSKSNRGSTSGTRSIPAAEPATPVPASPGTGASPGLLPAFPARGLPTGITNRSQARERWWKLSFERGFSARICLPALLPPTGRGDAEPAQPPLRLRDGDPGVAPQALAEPMSPPILSLRRLLNSRPPAAKRAGALWAPGVYQGAAPPGSTQKSPVMT